MFQLRRAALRVLSSPSTTSITRPRTLTSFTSISRTTVKPVLALQWQQRWASNDAEARRDNPTPAEDVSVSQSEPTSQEEVEQAVYKDSAASSRAGEDQAVPEIAEPIEDGASQSSSAVESAVASSRGAAPRERRSDAPRRSDRNESFEEREQVPKETVYVGNLFFDVTDNDLSKEFGRFGSIKSVKLIRDGRGLSKGFAYVEFETTESAQNAVDELNQQLFEGRRLLVAFAHSTPQPRSSFQPRSEKPTNQPSKTLFIGNMSFEMSDKDLNGLFKGIRNVLDVRVAIDRRTGQPRGFAHADFVDVKSAMEGFAALQGKETYGRKLRVDYSYGPSTAPRNTPSE